MSQDVPAISIFYDDKPPFFRVYVNDKELTDIRSFEVRIDNSAFREGVQEAPYFKSEQYLLRKP